MGKGRHSQPTKIKALRGNPGKRPLPENEPQPIASTGKAPAWLTGKAKAIWNSIVPPLLACGILTALDEQLLGRYCETIGLYRKCRDLLSSGGPVLDGKRNPAGTTMNDCLVQLRLMEVELGLTPSARSRLTTNPLDRREDSLESFLKVAGKVG